VPAAVCCALYAAQGHGDSSGGGCLAQTVEMSGFKLDGILQVVCMHVFLQRRIETGTVGELNPEWISGQQSLAEDN
jgi:hypothetical protein